MKIALVTHTLSQAGGGVSAVVQALCQPLAQRGTQVQVLGIEDTSLPHGLHDWIGIEVKALTVFGPRSLGWVPELPSLLRKYAPDIVHTHGIWMATSGQVAHWAQGFSKPYVVSPHGMLEPRALEISRWKKQLARRLFENAHLNGSMCIHALNVEEARHIRQFGLQNPIAIIPNGVALPELSQAQNDAPWGKLFPCGARVLLFLGRIHPKKNLLGLIRSIAAMKATRRLGDWKLAVVGWGEDEHINELENLISQLQLHNEVSFHGPLFGAEKNAAFRHASAFVLPSFSEGQPMAVLEAWAHGLPVAMTSACNLSIGFEHAAAVEIFTDTDSMIGPLTDFLQMASADLKAMGKAGRGLVETDFSWDSTAASFVDLYNWALGQGTQPDFVFDGNEPTSTLF